MISVILSGATGKMGQAIIELIKKRDGFELISSFSRDLSILEQRDYYPENSLILDFSHPMNTERVLKHAWIHKIPLLVGTTGLSERVISKLKKSSLGTKIMLAPNTSLTANLVAIFSEKAAALLPDYDAEIIDYHHRDKKDSPSGTALMIGESIASGRDQNLNEVANFESGHRGLRKDQEIGFSSIRAGGIYGNNEVIFAGQFDMISIKSSAITRDAFASGALTLGEWLLNQPEGKLYKPADLIG